MDGNVSESELGLRSLVVREGIVEMELEGNAAAAFAAAFAEQFVASGAENYLEVLFDHAKLGRISVTIQRVCGLTPGQKAARLEEELKELRYRMDGLEK